MAVLDFVRVAVDGVGKRIHNVLHALGGPDGDRYQQIIGIGDPDVAADIAKVRNSPAGATDLGLVVRPVDTPGKDSGLVALPFSMGAVPNITTDSKIRHIHLANISSGQALVTVANGSGTAYIGPDFTLGPRAILSVPMGGVLATGGLQWQTKNQNVNGQVTAD